MCLNFSKGSSVYCVLPPDNIVLISDSDFSSEEACTLVTLKVSGLLMAYYIINTSEKGVFVTKPSCGSYIQECSLVNQPLL